MNTYDIKCPKCRKAIRKSNLMCSTSGLLCSKCRIRFDIIVDSSSSKTGRYEYSNERPA